MNTRPISNTLLALLGAGLLLSGCGQAGPAKAATGGSGPDGSTARGGGSGSGGGGTGGNTGSGGGANNAGASGHGGAVSSGGAGSGVRSTGGSSGSGGGPGTGTDASAGGGPGGATSSGGAAGGAGAGGRAAPDAAADATTPPASPTTTAVYNGLRGQEFGGGWKFNRGDASGADKATFDDSAWKTIDLPHDWSIELAFSSGSASGSSGGYLDGGVGWYRKTFTPGESLSGQRIFIAFDGVYMNSQVWINGTSLGTRPYGYSTFEYDLTPNLKLDGSKNVIAVRVDNKQPNSRFYSGSGIYRNVWLTKLNPVHVAYSGVFVTTPTVSTTSAAVSVATEVQNQSGEAAQVTVSTTITSPDGSAVASNDSAATTVAVGATATVQQSLTVSAPKLWSPGTPSLYVVKVDVKSGGATVDTYLTSLGIRTAVFDANTGFSLNGTAMKLRGVNMHHDLGALGAAVNYRAIERQVEILKAMGANAIRTSHNPPAPELLDVTDRLGMLVLDEAFDTWEQTKTTNDYGVAFETWAERDIEAMVRRDRNHPSVILWSIGNEVGGGTTATAKKLKGYVNGLDKTRPVTWASNKMGGPHVSEGDDRNIADLLDVVGYNYAPYAGDYDADHKDHPSWKILGTETAAAVRSRGVYHTPASKVTKATSQSSADRQCSSYDNEAAGFGATAESAYSYDNDRPFVAGSFIWAGFDYIGEPTPYSSWPSKSSYYGIIDTAGFPKDVYYFYKSRWTPEPMVHILPHWNWSSGTDVTVYVYNNCDSVELFLNDKSQGSRTATAPALHAEWTLPWTSGTLRADCKRGGSVAASETVKTAGVAAKVVLSADRATIHADGKDLAFITADVRDASGVLVPTANNAITFSVSGAGQLVGVDNGDPTDTASYKGASRKAFSGKALAIVRATGTAGSITIKASAVGLGSDPLTVTSQ